MKLFQHSPLKHGVTLVNTTDIKVTSRLPRDVTKSRYVLRG